MVRYMFGGPGNLPAGGQNQAIRRKAEGVDRR
jgi:hypothetical protein